MAQQVAAARTIRDADLRSLDASLQAAHMTRQEFADWVDVVHEAESLKSRIRKDATNAPGFAVQAEIKAVRAQIDKLHPMDIAERDRLGQEYNRLVEAARDADNASRMCESALRQLERNYPDLLSTDGHTATGL
jgi:hypothetical protein